jgi:hypothetical protein
MTTTTHPSAPVLTSTGSRTVLLRWMATFPGFPLGGLAAMLLVGPVEGVASAVLGGLLTGAVLGATQSLGQRLGRRDAIAWTGATALGLGVGLGLGARLVDYGTALGDLVLQGLVTGLVVGLIQGVLLVRRGFALGLAWPAYVAGAWALGWAVTTFAGIRVEDQVTVFGASGAITVTALTSVLPLVIARPRR